MLRTPLARRPVTSSDLRSGLIEFALRDRGLFVRGGYHLPFSMLPSATPLGFRLTSQREGTCHSDRQSAYLAACRVSNLWARLSPDILRRPHPTPSDPHLCLDKGYDYTDTRELVALRHYIAHIKARSEEVMLKRTKRFKAYQWVVERTHSWFNRFRRILIRWGKKPENYLAMLHLGCAYLAYRTAGSWDRLLASRSKKGHSREGLDPAGPHLERADDGNSLPVVVCASALPDNPS